MDITLSKQALVRMLSTAGEVVDVKSAIPAALGCLYLFATDAQDGHLSVEGTDLCTTIRCGGPATVKQPGSALLPILFRSYATAMPDGDVRLYHTDESQFSSTATMVCMRSVATQRRYMMHSLPGHDWPREKINAITPATPDHTSFEAPSDLVALLLRCALTATGDNGEKVTGVALLRWGDKQMIAMGCDGDRMNVVKRPVDDDGRGELRLLKRSTKTIVKLLEGGAKASPMCRICVGNDGKWFSLELGDTVLYDRMMPEAVNYATVTPDAWATRVRVNREAFTALVKGVAVESETEIILHVRETDIVASCKVDGSIREVDEMPILQIENSKALGAKPIERTVGLRPRFVLDAIDRMTSEDLVFSMVHPERAVMFIPGDEEAKRPLDAKHLGLVMPLRF